MKRSSKNIILHALKHAHSYRLLQCSKYGYSSSIVMKENNRDVVHWSTFYPIPTHLLSGIHRIDLSIKKISTDTTKAFIGYYKT